MSKRNITKRNRTKRNKTKRRTLSGGSSPELIFLSSGSDEPEPEPVLQFDDVAGDLKRDIYGRRPNTLRHGILPSTIYENDYNSPELEEFINYTMAPRRPRMSFAEAMRLRYKQQHQPPPSSARADRAMTSARNALLNPRPRRHAVLPETITPRSVRQRILQGLYDMFISNRTPNRSISRNRCARARMPLDGGSKSKRRSKKRTKKR